MIKLAMLVSGGGSTAEHIWRQCQKGGSLWGLVNPVCLIASRPDAGAIGRLRDAGFTGRVFVVNPKEGCDKLALRLGGIFRSLKVDWFGQYGWLPKTPAGIARDFRGTNQHPGPVPWFGGKGMYGRAPHAAVLWFFQHANRSVCMTEATAQLVDPEFDQGARIARISYEPMALYYGREYLAENVAAMQKELLRLEHQVQVEALLRIVAYGGEIPPPVESSFQLLPGEEQLLGMAKRLAISDYPHG